MTAQSNSIQGNQFFTKIENTVSSINVEDALNNAEVLVTRVAKGRTTNNIGTAIKANIPIYTSLPTDLTKPETGDVLVLPAGAIVTRVLVGPDSNIEKVTERLTTNSTSAFRFYLVDDNVPTTKGAITTTIAPGVDFNKVLAVQFNSTQTTSFPTLGAVVVDVDAVATNDGTLVVEIHYVMPQF